MGMMSRHHIPFDDFSGFYKSQKRDKIVAFDESFSPANFKEVSYFYIPDKPETKNKYHSTLLISDFDANFFELKGKSNKEFRETRNKYDKIIDIRKNVDNIDSVIDLIGIWDKNSGFKYKWQRHSGYDRSFFLKYYEQEKDNLFSLFFYCNDVLVGYSIVSDIVENSCFKYVIRKFDISIGRNICLYIDIKTFENIYNIYGKSFRINWGASSGNVLKYKKKFPVFDEKEVWFYKVKND